MMVRYYSPPRTPLGTVHWHDFVRLVVAAAGVVFAVVTTDAKNVPCWSKRTFYLCSEYYFDDLGILVIMVVSVNGLPSADESMLSSERCGTPKLVRKYKVVP